jgi:hypothetical protein
LYTVAHGTVLTHVIVMFVDLSYVRPYPYLRISINSLTCLKLLKTSGTTSGERRGDNHRMRSPIKNVYSSCVVDPVTFWYGSRCRSGSSDPYLCLTDPDADQWGLKIRVSDPHWFNADPDTDPDPAFFLIADRGSGSRVWWSKIEKNLQLEI